MLGGPVMSPFQSIFLNKSEHRFRKGSHKLDLIWIAKFAAVIIMVVVIYNVLTNLMHFVWYRKRKE